MIILFEDERVAQLEPVTLSRPAFAISCGGYRLIDLVAELGAVEVRTRPHLRDVWAADHPEPPLPERTSADGATAGGVPAGGLALWLNARLVPSAGCLRQLREIVQAARPGVVRTGDDLAAALLPAGQSPLADSQREHGPELVAELPLLEHPHDIVRFHLANFSANLEHRLASGAYSEIAEGVFAPPGMTLHRHVATDASAGPIVLEPGVQIGPFSFLRGPLHIGRNAKIAEHAAIKDKVSLGHTTKIGGEVEASIVEPYTNKQHHGFLGHSYLGSWINLGEGTCTSDLKNTYGKINVEHRGQRVATGMQFLGSVVGDYTKAAINTSIFSGKIIGACSMLYGFVTTNVPSFVNYARTFGQMTEAPVEVLMATQARMFLRRGVHQRACDIQLLRDMYALTRHERKESDVGRAQQLAL